MEIEELLEQIDKKFAELERAYAELGSSYRELDQQLDRVVEKINNVRQYIDNEVTQSVRTVNAHPMAPEDIKKTIEAGWDNVKDRIYLWPMGKERCSSILGYIPHRSMGDIAATYMIEVPHGERPSTYHVIDNELMKRLGIDETGLFETALTNSQEAHPVICPALSEMIPDFTLPQRFGITDNSAVYILSTAGGFGGAEAVFYPGVLDKLQKEIPEGIYLMPTSRYEVLVVSKNMTSKKNLENFMAALQKEEIDPLDYVSEHVHTYDPKTKELCFEGMTREVKQEAPALKTNIL